VDVEGRLLDFVLDGSLKKLDMLAEGTVDDDVEDCRCVSKADTSCDRKSIVVVLSQAPQRHPRRTSNLHH